MTNKIEISGNTVSYSNSNDSEVRSRGQQLLSNVDARIIGSTGQLEITIRIDQLDFNAKSEAELQYVMGFAAMALESMKSVAVTLARKNYMYGNNSIIVTGQYGVAVRSYDKVARLLNIYKNNVDTDSTDESANDSWTDLMGYGFIGAANSSDVWDTITQNASDLGQYMLDEMRKPKTSGIYLDGDESYKERDDIHIEDEEVGAGVYVRDYGNPSGSDELGQNPSNLVVPSEEGTITDRISSIFNGKQKSTVVDGGVDDGGVDDGGVDDGKPE